MGACLNVHEGPMGISSSPRAGLSHSLIDLVSVLFLFLISFIVHDVTVNDVTVNDVTLDEHALEVGHIVTIEPGYYEAGNFGIRIENVVEVVEVRHAPFLMTSDSRHLLTLG